MNIDPNQLHEIQKLFDKLKVDTEIEDELDYNQALTEILGFDAANLDDEYDQLLRTKTLMVKKVNPDAILPKYNYESDSGFDLYSTIDVEIGPFGRYLVPTGLAFRFDTGFEIQIRTKSGLAINQGLIVLNSPGTVDQGYNGEIKVPLFNANQHPIMINKGMKIAQGVLCPVVNGGNVKIIEVSEIEKTDRGENGFGSTGIQS